MKISLKWLRELCPVDWTDDEIARRLTLAGLEVEGRHALALDAGIVAARVVSREPIAGSDHLSVCQVDDGAGTHQVVCGAQNYQAGDIVPMARPGARLPGGMEIRRAKMRGVESNGMLCSQRELGLSDDHAGLMILPAGTQPGVTLESLLGLPDAIFELNVTPNRADALSHLGVARDLAALSGVPLQAKGMDAKENAEGLIFTAELALKEYSTLLPPEDEAQIRAELEQLKASVAAGDAVKMRAAVERFTNGAAGRKFEHKASPAGPLPAQVEIKDAERCPRYVALLVEGVKVGPSPLDVQERLRSCGVRPISNVVDATNLALLELGHPLHAFDLDRLDGARIAVRRAAQGEPMTTLDGKQRTLSEDDLVIADAAKPVALAGVMGGATSEVSSGTTRILLEAAMFEPAGVRRTARRHALHTEASHRFERGMDERGALGAAQRCAELIVQLAGGRVLDGAIDVFPAPREPVKVQVRPGRVASVLGVEVPAQEVEGWLRGLQLAPAGDGRWVVPSWRGDLRREIDLIEEIARLRGFDTIPVRIHQAGVGETAAIDPLARANGLARAALSAHGLDEALNYSFVAARDLEALGAPDPVRVANPLTVEQGAMRTTLYAGLLRNLAHNLSRGVADARLYEVGRVYLREADPRHPSGALAWPDHEPRRLGIAMTGARAPKGWTSPGEPLDFYDLKGAVEDVLESLGIAGAAFRAGQSAALHPASSAELVISEKAFGSLGQIHPQVAAHFELPQGVWLAELDYDGLLGLAPAVKSIHAVPRFPAVSRDLAFVVDAGVAAESLLAEIRAADAGGLLERVALFDVYRGPQVGEGRKSVAFGLTLRAPDRTLNDAEADALITSVRERLRARVGAEIRA